ncbi:dTDP-4-dehydrorhamnose reductase [Nonomuraea sp. KC401]|uniref:dTDP-4-dehydrorhamnose reductase n=1 Tax=unclassified Nonomuraea TaxID=2593643 RepID=UPI0010FD3674|nr:MULTISPECIES: dTDP-4-dehydrorhamnose reductase [unclassified Nonomuraea]NBE91707.1 dTDP-4-dehydrorhamnose reductase [Nonomuraea sp. K271]TLF85835.1 dTDP-4-dehydrorhamnose reductase [Nonomuraea sp. KC401]
MRWLITGAGGMLATDVLDRTALTGDPVLALARSELDLRDRSAVRDFVRAYRPRAVINCAAWTAVDEAESREAEALAINGHAVRWLAEACDLTGARLVHVSTDYVFDGASAAAYREDAPTGPVNAYGRTKLAGERAALEHGHYVVRTAWLYGATGADFVRTMIRLSGERPFVDVVDDQRGQPTWAADLADFLVRLARSDLPPGVYHGVCSGETTWYGLAKEVFTLLGADPGRVRPVASTAWPRPARRPASSVLACTKAEPLRHWRAALHAAWPVIAAKAGPQCNVA